MKIILFHLQLKTEELFSLGLIRRIEFKDNNTAHFHRYMMYHLDKHNQVHSENISQPFIFRACGRLLCDSHSLRIHIIIRLDRVEKTFLEKGLHNTLTEGGQMLCICVSMS